MKGYAQRRIDSNAWEIALIDRENKKVITMEFRSHEFKDGMINETTMVYYNDIEILRALSEALIEIGIMPENGTAAELKATKYHLEDMRKLALK